MQWHTQDSNITSNLKVEVIITLFALRVKNSVTWKCHVDDYNNFMYDMILVRYLLT